MPPGNTSCSPETTTCYVFTYDGRLVREYLNNATQRDFLYAGSQRIGVSEKIGAAFRLHYFITDHLGSTRSFIDSTGLVKATYNYYPFGGTRTSTVTTDTKRRYTGKELDDEDIQQYYYGARYLNGATQCFNSVDPLAAKYPGWSPYCYALANPVRNLDRKGKNPVAAFAILYSLYSLVFYPNTAAAPSSADQPVERGRTTGDEVRSWAVDAGMVIGGAAAGRLGAGLATRIFGRAEVEADATAVTKFLQNAANKAEAQIGGKGGVAGTAKHEVFKDEVRAAKDAGLSSEVSYKGGELTGYGAEGSVRVDAVHGPKEKPTRVYELKTGGAKLTEKRLRDLEVHLPPGTPMQEIKPILGPPTPGTN